MKIAVIFTGGTIGTEVKDGWMVSEESTRYRLLENCGYSKEEVEFVPFAPYTVLSENLSSKELNMLQRAVGECLTGDYDGIIVTHGTDTLQYSATALEYAFNGCDIPVIVVSAAYPLGDARTNGYTNFIGAVEFIKNKPRGGVFVSYRNSWSEHTDIHIPSRILQHSECSSDIYSIDGFPFARYGKDGFEILGRELSENSVGIVDYCHDSGILTVESTPGNSYSHSLEGIRAVLLKPYHSATLDTRNSFLADFCKRAKEKGIPVFVVNVKGGVQYESAKLYKELSLEVLPYSTFVSAYMKVWIAVSRQCDAVVFAKRQAANEF